MTPFARQIPLIALAAIAWAGCGTSAFSPHFRDNNLEDLKKALADLSGAKQVPMNAAGTPMAFVVTDAPIQIVAYDLQSKKRKWQVKAPVTSRVVVGRSRVYHRQGKRQLVARSIDSGQVLWSVELLGGDRLLGLTSDGDSVYYVTERVKRSVQGEIALLVCVDGTNGGKRWSRSSSGRLGAPVVHQGKVFVPLRFQSIAILDAADGREAARIRSKEETLLWVRRSPAGILYGGKNGVYRLDERSVAGDQKGSTFIAAALPSSVRPAYWWDGYNAALSGYTAYDRNRLVWQLTPDGTRFLNDTIVVHSYRFFFAFDTLVTDPKRSMLRWAYAYPRHDVVASSDTGASLVLVTDNGNLIVLDPKSGMEVMKDDLKLSVRGATFDAAGFAPTMPAAGSRLDLRRPDLRQSLTQIIWDPDRRFDKVKLFCVDELSRLTGGDVSRDLVKIVTHETVDRSVYKRAGDALVARHDKTAIPLYLETLKSRFSFVDGTRGKAVDIMARALGDLKATEAVQPLLQHLADHETPILAVVEVVRALSVIGDKTILEPFRDFLLTYRCDPMFNDAPAALNLVAESLLKLGGQDEWQLLSFVQNDPHTLQSLRTYLDKALRQSTPKGKPKNKEQKPTKSAAK